MSDHRSSLGRRGERYAARRLQARGWRMLAANVRTARGELDLIALTAGVLVVVEVKTVRAGARRGPERAVLAVDPRKRRQVRMLTREWLATRPAVPRFEQIRFDAIGIEVNRALEVVRFEHLEGAF